MDTAVAVVLQEDQFEIIAQEDMEDSTLSRQFRRRCRCSHQSGPASELIEAGNRTRNRNRHRGPGRERTAQRDYILRATDSIRRRRIGILGVEVEIEIVQKGGVVLERKQLKV